jgi:predicted nucleotidyltransferase
MQPSDATPEKITEALRPLMRRPDVQLIILFGSAARGDTHRDSDIDVGILAVEAFDPIGMTNEISGYLGTSRVDVVDLRRASPLLALEALRHGRLLYESRPGSYAAFYSLALRRYVDTSKLRAAQQQAIGNFLAARGLA